jgi:hypothetical protein
MTATFALLMAASLPVYAQTSSTTTAASAPRVAATQLQPADPGHPDGRRDGL